jgi:hypothetical protein
MNLNQWAFPSPVGAASLCFGEITGWDAPRPNPSKVTLSGLARPDEHAVDQLHQGA